MQISYEKKRVERMPKKAARRIQRYMEHFEENPDMKSPWSDDRKKFYKSKIKNR
jgi:hypothetical protein